jgi:hypothetical protein
MDLLLFLERALCLVCFLLFGFSGLIIFVGNFRLECYTVIITSPKPTH